MNDAMDDEGRTTFVRNDSMAVNGFDSSLSSTLENDKNLDIKVKSTISKRIQLPILLSGRTR